MWNWLRGAKTIALLAFILPWVTVSCSQRPIATLSGVSLMTGNVSLRNPMTGAVEQHDGSINVWLVLAVLSVLAGLTMAIMAKKHFAWPVLVTSIVALLLVWIGTSGVNATALQKDSQANGQLAEAGRAAAEAMIQFTWRFGFWLEILALIVAAAIAWSVASGRTIAVSLGQREPTSP